MKKILFVATVVSHIRSFHLPYLKMLQENGYKTYVAANWNIGKGEEIEYCDEFIQIPIQRSPYSLKNLKAIRELKKIIDKEQFDIIHCHTPMGSVVARTAAKKARKKYGTRVIYTAHGFHFFDGAPKKNWLLFYPVEWYLSKYTDTLITINQEDYNIAKNKFFKRCRDIEYVPGVGIDVEKFNISLSNKEIECLKNSLGLSNDDFVVTCVARLDKNKNQGFIIECMKEVIKVHSNIHLLLVGPDELNGYYQKKVENSNLSKNVHFLGRRNDVPELLKISNVVVSASKREGLPVNIIEALSSGTPVVALRCRGMSDLISDGQNGFIVESDSDFINTLLSLYNDDYRKKISENDSFDSKKYSKDSILKYFMKIYDFKD